MIRRLSGIAAGLALALALVACTGGDPNVGQPTAVPSPSAAATASSDASAHPAPGRTVEATPPAQFENLRGVRIATVVPDAGLASQALQAGMRAIADQYGLVVEEFVAADGPMPVDAAVATALATEPHVVVGLGEGAVDAIAYASSQYLDQDFLLIGAQSAEPTSNVTAVIWGGATSRGSGAPGDDASDEASVTSARAGEAIASGLGSVLTGVSGIVLHLSD